MTRATVEDSFCTSGPNPGTSSGWWVILASLLSGLRTKLLAHPAARRNAGSGHKRAADAASLGAGQLLVVCTPWVALIAVSRVDPIISTEAQRNRETEELEHVVLKSEREETSSTPTCGSSACDSGGQHFRSGPNKRPVLSCGQLCCCSHFYLPSKLSFCLLCPPCTIRVRTSTSRLSSNWRWKNFHSRGSCRRADCSRSFFVLVSLWCPILSGCSLLRARSHICWTARCFSLRATCWECAY